jgi:hypothetical protein
MIHCRQVDTECLVELRFAQQCVAGASLVCGGDMQVNTIRTPEKEIALTAALHERPSYLSACRKANISRAAFYQWKQSDPAFAERIEAARNVGLDALEDALIARGLKNDTTAAIFMLKSHRREIYGDRLNIDVQIRKKAEQMADALGVPVDELEQAAFAIARNAWDAWSPQ